MPPQRTGIADYSAELLEWLALLCEIEVFTDRAAPVQDDQRRYSLWPFEYYEARALRQPFDLNIYQIGNNAKYHEHIYRRALQQPGLVVLHDTSLFDLQSNLSLARGHVAEFWSEVEYCEGVEGRSALERDMPAIERDHRNADRLRFPLTRRLIDNSRAVLVHSQWARDRLRQRSRFKWIEAVPQGSPLLEGDAGARVRAQHGWDPDQLLIGLFGGITPFKRVEIVLAAFQQLYTRYPTCRLVVAGREDQQQYVVQMRLAAEAAGLGDALVFLGELPFNELQDYLQAVDLVINLRWPTVGETSAITMRAFGAGKPVITSDVAQFREYDAAFCWRVPIEPEAESVALHDRLEYAATHLVEVHAAGSQAREYIRQNATWPLAAEHYRKAILAAIDSKSGAHASPVHLESDTMPGVNVIGDFSMAIGLSEAAANMLEAMLLSHIPVAYTELLYAANQQMPQINPRAEALTSDLPRGNPYPINLLHYNLHELTQISEDRLRSLTGGKYTIGRWYWELDQIPVHFRTQIGRVDEIWVSSKFARRSFAALTTCPIEVIPMPITVTASPDAHRRMFGLPDNRYLFFFHFSATSCDSRKNPSAVIKAFEQAFGSQAADGPLLVIKAQHLAYFPEMQRSLLKDIERVGGILLTENYTRQQMNDLLSCIDAYVSLHRAEAFGAGIAEAMALGKPVIATNYSGNTDFMTSDNSYPVRYQLRLVTVADSALSPDCQFLYEPGQVWAEPDVQHAAEWMDFLYTHPDAGRAQGQRAAESIRRFCSPEVVGQTIARRLRELSRLMPLRQEQTL